MTGTWTNIPISKPLEFELHVHNHLHMTPDTKNLVDMTSSVPNTPAHSVEHDTTQ